MEPISTLKRNANEITINECLVCQHEKLDDKLYNGSAQGLQTLKDRARERLKKNDIERRLSIDRIISADSENTYVWHKSCYSSFTSRSHINRLNADMQASTSTEGAKPLLRSNVETADWKRCMFCQQCTDESLFSVATLVTSIKIIDLSQYDRHLRIRLAGVNDLIAAEAKYHLKCYSKFVRETTHMKTKSRANEVAIGWLIKELKLSAAKGHILSIDDVFDYYSGLCKDAGEEIPQSFISRRYSFTEEIKKHTEDVYTFQKVELENSEVYDKGILLVPKGYESIPITTLLDPDNCDAEDLIPVFKPGDDIFLSLVHTALKLRSDILAHEPYKGVKVSKEAAIECIPDSLYMFMKILYGGQEVLDRDGEDNDEEDEVIGDDRIISVSQDVIFGVSDGKRWTPKHVGLASTIHQATRSRNVVQLLHKAGHSISYKDILSVDTALAEQTLVSLDEETGATIPENLVKGRFVHFSTDNIDILDASLDGKNTFHGTQVTAWQRGPPSQSHTLESITPSKHKLDVPESVTNITPPSKPVQKPEPKFDKEVKLEWFSKTDESDPSVLSAQAKDLLFNVRRHADDPLKGWSQWNQERSKIDPPCTTVGFLPLVLNPAHEYDTLNTVVLRCKHIANSLGQRYVVISADEQLYSRLMELKWSQDYDFLIPRLPSLHGALNFLKVFGQHLESAGLYEVWVDSCLLGDKTAKNVLAGKNYEKGIRAHKITFQSLWHILFPQFVGYLAEHNPDMKHKIEEADMEDDDIYLLSLFTTEGFQTALKQFASHRSENATFALWFGYMEMVSILLLYTRAQRDGDWNLHLASFKMMLPYFHQYAHLNYMKWGSIYYAEMQMLPPEILSEFQAGNFVVKIGSSVFNQVDADQSQEWLNGTGKRSGGIVGITKDVTSLSRWALSFNLRSDIAKDTKEMFGIDIGNATPHKECNMSRRREDTEAEQKVMSTLQSFGVFEGGQNQTVSNIATKDQATQEITESLCCASKEGQKKLECFVRERLLPQADNENADHRKFHDPMKRSYPATFGKLFETGKKDMKTSSIKVDRSILQRLVISYAAGRDVNLEEILKHELLPVPIAIAEMNGSLKSGEKSILKDVLLKNVNCPDQMNVSEGSTLVIDGQFLIKAVGNPTREEKTFGDFAGKFLRAVFGYGQHFERVDLTFDRYNQYSIKSATRTKRKRGVVIRRVIEHADVPLPHDWDGFLSDPENKQDLSDFLSHQFIENAPNDVTAVAAGGLLYDEESVLCNKNMDVEALKATHEEADTRIILHVCHTMSRTVYVWARDTDILVLLMAHSYTIDKDVFMKAGTTKAQQFIHINEVVDKCNVHADDSSTLLAYHAITGSDTTSYLAGHSKRTSFDVFCNHKELLSDLGKDPLTHETIMKCEKFICHVYKVDADRTDEARIILFKRGVSQESLPPTSDAVVFHIQRAHLQTLIWIKATEAKPDVPEATDNGWEMVCGDFVPKLTSLPAVPEACVNLIRCSCKGTCTTLRCSCRKAKLKCTGMCKCVGHCLNSV